jgi:phage FluMu protein Com
MVEMVSKTTNRQVTVYIYNYPDDPLEDWRCSKDGSLLMQVKGQMAYIITSPGIPVHMVRMPNVGYLRHKCRKCGTVYNALIVTFSLPAVSATLYERPIFARGAA